MNKALILRNIQDYIFPQYTCALCGEKDNFSWKKPWCAACEAKRIKAA